MICDYNDTVIVGPDVERYAVYEKRIITGIVKMAEPDSVPGMFVIDMQTREVYRGLEENRLQALVRSYGIPDMPRMRRPGFRLLR